MPFIVMLVGLFMAVLGCCGLLDGDRKDRWFALLLIVVGIGFLMFAQYLATGDIRAE